VIKEMFLANTWPTI